MISLGIANRRLKYFDSSFKCCRHFSDSIHWSNHPCFIIATFWTSTVCNILIPFSDIVNQGEVMLKPSDKVKVTLDATAFKALQDFQLFGGWSDGMTQVMFSWDLYTTLKGLIE